MTPDTLLSLIARFAENIDSYRNAAYNEAQTRKEFIDPLFQALGWDMSNTLGYAEAYKDVIHEDAVKIGTATKAPDYSFRIGGVRKFFLEAKKPSENIDTDVAHAYQLRRYAWSANLPLSILTNFRELSVYDCRIKPNANDKASAARVKYMKFDEYPARWDEIAGVFSKEAILHGSFDKYAEKGGRGTAQVDKEFLREIESWREELAKNIALRNKNLSVRDLNFAVQRTIDRIIFLRMCEDRGIEIYGKLQALMNGHNVYARLRQYFDEADDRYNSGIFHFRKEKGRAEEPDEFTPSLIIDDKALKAIIGGLYYPTSPYEFSVIGADILGNVYEQFLGKVIRLTPGHQAKVEDKPEVKKAGGVYYTPKYIVDYIVKNTVGKLLGVEGQGSRVQGSDEGLGSRVQGLGSVNQGQGFRVKGLGSGSLDEVTENPIPYTPNPIPSSTNPIPLTPKEISKLRILDPACGSGSFLIGAYQYLLDYHRDWYVHDGAAKHKKVLFEGFGGQWQLTTQEKKRILVNNIYGVDIDSQAVEVTKLNLMLKVLEGENAETLNKTLQLFHERALPDLGNNIKCGNSLIGPDFYDGEQLSFLDDEERYRINAFDWKKEFRDVFEGLGSGEKGLGDRVKGLGSGFDCVIGNPPYIRIQAMKEWAPIEVEFYKHKYKAASAGNYDIYVVFVEKGLSLLNEKGRLGFILPHKFFNSKYGSSVRSIISNGKHLSHVVHFGANQVFVGATTYTCLMFLTKETNEELIFNKVYDLSSWNNLGESNFSKIRSNTITENEWNFTVGVGSYLFERLNNFETKLDDVADIFVGLQTSADDVFIMNYVRETKQNLCLYSKSLNREWTFEKDLFYPIVSGTDVNRYSILPDRQFILFPYSVNNENASLLDFEDMSTRFPKTAEYLSLNKKRLEEREKGKFRGYQWQRFGRNQNIGIQNRIKLCVPRLVERLYCSYDSTGTHFLDNVDVGGITFKNEYASIDLKYLLGLLNSKLLRWYFPFVSAPFRGGWLSANKQFLSQLPLPTSFKDSALTNLVDEMLNLHRKLAAANIGHEKTMLQRQIEATDAQIDRLVYKLYGLTEEEIRIVEEEGS